MWLVLNCCKQVSALNTLSPTLILLCKINPVCNLKCYIIYDVYCKIHTLWAKTHPSTFPLMNQMKNCTRIVSNSMTPSRDAACHVSTSTQCVIFLDSLQSQSTQGNIFLRFTPKSINAGQFFFKNHSKVNQRGAVIF